MNRQLPPGINLSPDAAAGMSAVVNASYSPGTLRPVYIGAVILCGLFLSVLILVPAVLAVLVFPTAGIQGALVTLSFAVFPGGLLGLIPLLLGLHFLKILKRLPKA